MRIVSEPQSGVGEAAPILDTDEAWADYDAEEEWVRWSVGPGGELISVRVGARTFDDLILRRGPAPDGAEGGEAP